MRGIVYQRRRLAGTEDKYEVSARIVSAEAEDGSPLDEPFTLATDFEGSGSISTYAAPGTSVTRTAGSSTGTADSKTTGPGNTATSPTGSTTGGAGSGGIYPGKGLPFNIPEPFQNLALILIAAGLAFVVVQGRR